MDAFQEWQQRLAIHGLADEGERTEGLAVKTVEGGDESLPAGIELGQFHRPFNRLGAAVGKKTVLDVARGQLGDDLGQMGAQGVEHLLAVLGAPVELGLDCCDDFRMSDTRGVEAETAEHVDILATHDIAQNRSFAVPVGEGEVVCLGDRLAVFEEALVDMVGEVPIGGLGHPAAVLIRDILLGGRDQLDHAPCLDEGMTDVAAAGAGCGRCGFRFKCHEVPLHVELV